MTILVTGVTGFIGGTFVPTISAYPFDSTGITHATEFKGSGRKRLP
jgi:nucleoside-diphosphate-sugar epimerase